MVNLGVRYDPLNDQTPAQPYFLSVPKRLGTTLTMILTLVIAACGGDDAENSSSVPGNADPAAVRVIGAWTRALDKGDIDAAARYFAIPADTQNGIALRLHSRDDARAFNQSLPCGAELLSAKQKGTYTIATFRLTERPGAGKCGSGAGARAATAFLIEDGAIAEWRRVPLPGEENPAPAAPGSSA